MWFQYDDGIKKANTECIAHFKRNDLRKWYIKEQNIRQQKCLVWHKNYNLEERSRDLILTHMRTDQTVFFILNIWASISKNTK